MRNHVRGVIDRQKARQKVLQAGQVKGDRNSERCRYQQSIGELETLVVECSTMVASSPGSTQLFVVTRERKAGWSLGTRLVRWYKIIK